MNHTFNVTVKVCANLCNRQAISFVFTHPVSGFRMTAEIAGYIVVDEVAREYTESLGVAFVGAEVVGVETIKE